MDQDSSKSFEIRPERLDDAQAIAALFSKCSIERTGRPKTTAQYVRDVMQTPGVNLETDSLLVMETSEQLLGYTLLLDLAPQLLYDH